MLFIEGLLEPLRGWVKAFDPPALQEAMKKARSMELVAPSSKFGSSSKFGTKGSSSFRDNRTFPKNKEKSDFKGDQKGKSAAPFDRETINDLQKTKLCFYCKGPYDANHDCPLRPKGKATRAMWVFYEDSKSENSEQQADQEESDDEKSKKEEEKEREIHLQEARITSI